VNGRERVARLSLAEVEHAERERVDPLVVEGRVGVLGAGALATDLQVRTVGEEDVEVALLADQFGRVAIDVPATRERERVRIALGTGVDMGDAHVAVVEFLLDGDRTVEVLRDPGVEDEHARDRGEPARNGRREGRTVLQRPR